MAGPVRKPRAATGWDMEKRNLGKTGPEIAPLAVGASNEYKRGLGQFMGPPGSADPRNMSTLRQGPLGERADRINFLISALQNSLNTAWRAASKDKNQEKLSVAQKAIDENEAKLQAAVQPVPIHFEIAPAK